MVAGTEKYHGTVYVAELGQVAAFGQSVLGCSHSTHRVVIHFDIGIVDNPRNGWTADPATTLTFKGPHASNFEPELSRT